MTKLIGGVAFVGFCPVARGAHRRTARQRRLQPASRGAAPSPRIFVVVLPLIFIERRRRARLQTTLRERAPRAIAMTAAALAVYAIVNFVIFIATGYEGGPEIRDGGYVLLSHGRFVRELTLAQYVAGRANEARGFSGHWMVFYFVPFAYFWFADRSVQAATTEPPTTTR
jgi:hypothetical protein